MSVKDFLDKKPSLGEIADFVEKEAQRIAAERKKMMEQAGVTKSD